MTTATATKTARTLIAAATSNAAAGTTRGTLDLRTAFGGLLTMKLTNGGTGPTVAAQARILVAHNAGATPTAASANVDWKTLWSFSGDLVASSITEQSIRIDDSVMHVEVEVTGNTGQAVTCEAFLSELTSINNG